MGRETSELNRSYRRPDMSLHPDVAPASKRGSVGDRSSGKPPNVLQKESHDIDESDSDVPEQALLAVKTSPGEPGDATISLPCPPTDSRTAAASTAAPEIIPNTPTMRGPPPSVSTDVQWSRSRHAGCNNEIQIRTSHRRQIRRRYIQIGGRHPRFPGLLR